VIFSYFYSDVYISGKSYKNFKYFYQKWTYFVYFYIVNELYISGLLVIHIYGAKWVKTFLVYLFFNFKVT